MMPEGLVGEAFSAKTLSAGVTLSGLLPYTSSYGHEPTIR